MRCWGDSNPWVAPEHVMKNDLKHERVRMRIKSASEVRTKPKVRAPRPEMNRQQHTLEEARKKDKERWEKERALVHDSTVARSSMLFAGGALQVGPSQPPSVPSSGKERLLNENQGRTEWADRGGVDVQMQEQELSANLTSASMLDVNETLRIGDDCGREFPAVEGFDPFSPTVPPPNQRLSSDSIVLFTAITCTTQTIRIMILVRGSEASKPHSVRIPYLTVMLTRPPLEIRSTRHSAHSAASRRLSSMSSGNYKLIRLTGRQSWRVSR
ncbi:hypothetical protein F5146DRAFT_1051861 [Armillaria mellea]|nr:hypothetical protein F5146DRAFT_1051861 [Armillaria mellea]